MAQVAASMPANRLAMNAVSKAFGGVSVLENVTLEVNRGEVVALLGGNGAGKSTLVKILSGVYHRDVGHISIDGEEVDVVDPRVAASLGICLLPQEISIVPDMTVAENISLAAIPTKRRAGLQVVDYEAMRARARDLLSQLGFAAIDSNSLVGSLSVAERRVVEIARALAGNARILIMDEPTAALTEQEAQKIFHIIRRLKEQSTAIIYISHYLREVFEIADRIIVLRDGRNAGEFVTRTSSPGEVVEAMLGAKSKGLFEPQRAATVDREKMLDVRDLGFGRFLQGIAFNVAKGEIFGVFGLVGSGIEHLGRAIYGALGPGVSGDILIDGKPYHPASPAVGKSAGIGFVAAERKREGIIPDLSVRENIVAAFVERYVSGFIVSRQMEEQETKRLIDVLGIRTRGHTQVMRTLSGGNQQKVCVARWLAGDTRLLILEEPTRGVDVGARRDIYRELRKLSENGLAILILSSDVEEVAGLSDQSIVIDRGTLVGRFPAGSTPGELMAATAPKQGH